jgi:hypothetical protein
MELRVRVEERAGQLKTPLPSETEVDQRVRGVMLSAMGERLGSAGAGINSVASPLERTEEAEAIAVIIIYEEDLFDLHGPSLLPICRPLSICRRHQLTLSRKESGSQTRASVP